MKSSAFFRRRTAGKFLKVRPDFNIYAKKKISSNITLEVNFLTTLDVNFILLFKLNFILTCYFVFLKARLGNMKKRKIFELCL
jgi:hypothetical protein